MFCVDNLLKCRGQENLLLRCGDIEANPGPNPPRSSSVSSDSGLRQTRLPTPSRPVKEPSMTEMMFKLNNMDSSLSKKLDGVREDVRQLRQDFTALHGLVTDLGPDMDLSQFCQSAIPWPKVFSPKVIIRDGQGCHDSLSPNPVLPSQHETEVCNDQNQDSPVLLDLSQSAKYEYHCVSHANCSSSTNRKQCNICLPNEHSCISCRKDSQHGFLGTSCQSPKEVQTSKKMFSRSQDQHHNSNSSKQDIRDEADPYSRHESVLGTPDWSTLGSLMPDWKVSCSGAMVPPDSEYHVSYPKDLRMPALSWCSQHKPSLRTGHVPSSPPGLQGIQSHNIQALIIEMRTLRM
ncbi:hypothetical protein ACOMHN_047658 [Nucella lapillus]